MELMNPEAVIEILSENTYNSLAIAFYQSMLILSNKRGDDLNYLYNSNNNEFAKLLGEKVIKNEIEKITMILKMNNISNSEEILEQILKNVALNKDKIASRFFNLFLNV